MKKTIKRIISTMLALCLLCVTALAAAPTENGVYDVQGLTPKTAEDGAISPVTATVGGKDQDFYPAAERFDLSFTGSANEQCLVFLLEGNASGSMPTPTKSNIYYIDQKDGAAAVFNLFPMTMKAGDYSVWMTRTGGDAAEKVGSFRYHEAVTYTLGDVNGDEKINPSDAAKILRYVIHKDSLEGGYLKAADVNGDEKINPSDAAKILRYVIHKDTLG